ncbi:MAG: hypothetical protein ABSC21_12275 [Terriglobia bacterium]|jgi:hypothetical protein
MRIAMIGIKGIPARFGGFETAGDELSRGLVKRGLYTRVNVERATAGQAPKDKCSGQSQPDCLPLTEEAQPIAD